MGTGAGPGGEGLSSRWDRPSGATGSPTKAGRTGATAGPRAVRLVPRATSREALPQDPAALGAREDGSGWHFLGAWQGDEAPLRQGCRERCPRAPRWPLGTE